MTRLDLEGLLRATERWAPAVRFLPEVDSTNRVAAEWLEAGAPHGSIVVTEHQVRGRGRLGRTWFSPPGTCLLCSIILRPNVAAVRIPLFNLAAGVALCQSAEELGVVLALKWPNDVMAVSKKVAGILSEHHAGAIVLGMGVNVNVERFPDEIADLATSFAIEAGHPFDRLDVLERFLARFHALSGSDLGEVPAVYRTWCETLGRQVRVELPGRVVEGAALDVDLSGALVMEGGEVVHAGDVVHLRERIPKPGAGTSRMSGL